MGARNKEARRDSAVRGTTLPAPEVPQGFPAKGDAQSQFALTAERVAFLVTGFHRMAGGGISEWTPLGFLSETLARSESLAIHLRQRDESRSRCAG